MKVSVGRCLVLVFALSTIFINSGCRSLGGNSLAEWKANGFKVGPNHCPPNARVAETWRELENSETDVTSTQHLFWWENFNDPTLTTLIQTAEQQNLSLRQAGLRVLQAQAAREIAVGNLFPQTQAASGGYQRTLRPGESVGASWSQGFAVTWELDFWGEFRRRIEAADADLCASEFSRRDVLICLYSDIGQAFVTVRSLQSQIWKATANRSKELDQIAASNQVRRKLKNDLILSAEERDKISEEQFAPEVTLHETEAAIAELKTKLFQAENALAVLLGIVPCEIKNFTMLPDNVEPRVPGLGAYGLNSSHPPIPIGTPSDLITRRPDVRQAERAVASQCAKVGIAITDLYPSISLVGSSNWSGPDFGNAFDAPNLTGVLNPRFSWAILNYGRIRANIAGQKAKLQELCAAYELAILNAQREVEDSRVAYANAAFRQSQFRLASEAAENAIEKLKRLIAKPKQQGDLVLRADDFSADFDVQLSNLVASKINNDNAAIAAEADIALNAIKLYKATGGGWSDCTNCPNCVNLQTVACTAENSSAYSFSSSTEVVVESNDRASGAEQTKPNYFIDSPPTVQPGEE